MAKKAAAPKKSSPTLGEVVMVYTKSSSHWYALIEPQITEIEETKFITGIQVTGKQGHRMERKRTLIPLDHVASIIEFQSEDDLWSEPQAKLIRPPEDELSQSALLTSHEQPKPTQGGGHQGGGRHNNNRRDRHPRNNHKPGEGRFNDRDRGGFNRGRGGY